MTETAGYRELRRSRDGRMIAGVCGGLGRYFDVNPAFYRVGFVVLALLGGAGILIYGAALLVIPNEGEQESIATETLRKHRERPLALVALAIVAVAGISLLSRASLWPHGDAAWVLLLVAGAILLWAQRREKGARPRVLRTILIALGALITLVLVAGAIAASVFSVHLNHGVGDRSYHPASLAGLQRTYHLGVGSLRLDLGDVAFPAGETRIDVDAGVGDVRIVVPNDVSVRVDASADVGQVNVFDRTDDGRHSSVTDTKLVGKGRRLLLIHAHVGAGKVEVERAVR
jgi:phage shock protein PspC (stress-responsive transcriptional regulator)